MTLSLDCINIMNFKSFKGKHSITRLDKHITVIVGPNGSGKSNVIDSILFVLGFKAKKMRHAVLKDLIFAGCTECYVELVFSEFVIRRSLRLTAKSCTSAYFINNSEKQAQEVICFLKDKEIDLDNNRFLILQGEIETISMMGPLELLDYIEDCIEGCSNDKLNLKMQIQNLEDEIKTKQEELEMQENSLKFIETDFNYKKGRRDEKYDILSYRSESLALKNKICLIKEDICMRKEKKLNLEKGRLKNSIGELAIRNKGCVGKIKELENLCDGINLKNKEEALLKYKKEYQRIERENRAKDLKRSKLEKNIERVEKEIVETRQKLKNFASESVLLNESLKKNCSEIEEFEREIEEKTTELNGFKDFIDTDKEKKSLERILIDKINKREAMKNNKAFLLDSKLKCINNQILMLRENKAISISDLAGAEKEVNQLRSDIQQTTQEIQKRKRRSEDFKFIEQSYLKERDVLLNLQEVKGVYGFLKDLGAIEKGYEDAVDASTKSLSSIVVENTKVAEECVSIINQKRLARTTFIILDKLENSLPKPNLAEASNLLYKKIKCDAKFEKCFYFALRDTMVVKTAEEAKSLAFGRVRRRVVTVDGELFEKSGVMSGGKFSKKIKSSHELEDLSKKMNALLETKLNKIQEINNLKSLMRQSEDIAKEIAVHKLKGDEKNILNLEREIERIKDDVVKLENKSLPLRITELKGDIRMLNEKINFLHHANQEIKIKLGSEPTDNLKILENELKRYSLEMGQIELDLVPSADVLNDLECEYKHASQEFKAFHEQINKLREEMGKDYHEEAECKSKLEEFDDRLNECYRISENCRAKICEINNEFLMIKAILETSVDQRQDEVKVREKNIKFLETEIPYIKEVEDEELKKMSKDFIEELTLRESENFRKLKNVIKADDNLCSNDDIEIYRQIFRDYEDSRTEYEKLKKTCDFLGDKLISAKVELETLKTQRLNRFMEGFTSINKNIKDIFNLITMGGNAELDLIDYLNPFSEGIILSIMPPKKAWKQVSHLSGGEKTLSSLSLIFALHKYKPSLFYIMDEIDAALDFKNVSIIAQYISRINSQFIIISLRNDMFEMANTLLGVYKTNDASKTVMVNVDKLI